MEAPPQTLPKGRELLLAVFEAVVWCSFPLGKAGMGLRTGLGAVVGLGLLWWMVRTPGNSVGVAFSRRRYPQQDKGQVWVGGKHKIEYNAYG